MMSGRSEITIGFEVECRQSSRQVVASIGTSPMESRPMCCFRCSRPVVIPPGQAQRKSKRDTVRSMLALARIVEMQDETEVAMGWLMVFGFRWA